MFSTGPNSMPRPNLGFPGANVFQQAAGNLTAAGNAAQGVAGFQPRMVGVGQVAGTNLQPYMNPFQQQVINRTMSGLDRTRQATLNDVGASATAAGAFGGSRHGVAESLTNAEFARTAADTMAGLNAANFANAQGMAGADIDRRFGAATANQQAGLAGAGLNLQAAGQLGSLSNLGFGQGQQIVANQAAQGGQQQQMMQALIDAARQQFQGATGAPTQGLATLIGALGGVPYAQSSTTSQTPGLLQLLSLGLGAA